MTENVRTVPMTGKRVTWDGSNEAELASLAGSAYLGHGAGYAVVRTWSDGEPVSMRPGWQFILWDDGSWVISSPGQPNIQAVP